MVAQAGLAEWQRIITIQDWDALPELLTEQVGYRNPASFEPFYGKDTITAILRAVFSVFENFAYLRHFSSNTGYVLEFSAKAGDEQLFGVDILEFDENGKISDLMVMIRPVSAVMTLATEAGKRLAEGQAVE